MPRRLTGRPSRRNKRTYVRKGRPTVAKLARQVRAIRTRLPEKRTVDNGLIDIDFSSTAQFTLLNGIQLGDEFYQREGKDITITGIHLRGMLSLTGSATATGSDYCRLILIYDRQANGAAPTFANIFSTRDQANNAVSTAYALRNVVNKKRFKILMDKHFSYPPVDANVTIDIASKIMPQLHGQIKSPLVDWGKRVKLPVVYSGSTNPSVIADIQYGSLYLIAVGLYSTPQHQFQGFLRMYYNG